MFSTFSIFYIAFLVREDLPLQHFSVDLAFALGGVVQFSEGGLQLRMRSLAASERPNLE